PISDPPGALESDTLQQVNQLGREDVKRLPRFRVSDTKPPTPSCPDDFKRSRERVTGLHLLPPQYISRSSSDQFSTFAGFSCGKWSGVSHDLYISMRPPPLSTASKRFTIPNPPSSAWSRVRRRTRQHGSGEFGSSRRSAW